MRRYHAYALLVAAAGILLAVGLRLPHRACREAAGGISAHRGYSCDACSPAALPGAAAPGGPPRIPSGSGLPCMVVFHSVPSRPCQEMLAVANALSPRLKGKLDLIPIDADRHRQEAMRWRLRTVPTCILVGPDGKEIGRHEGSRSRRELLADLRAAGVRLGP